MPISPPRLAASAAALVALALGGLWWTASDPDPAPAPPAPPPERALAGSPPPLARLHAQAGELLGGGPVAFRSRLADLRGYPVVVNKWASWCGPCRTEFKHFGAVALDEGREVAFIGVDALDNRQGAIDFLREHPVSYPHYEDPEQEIARLFRGNGAFPTTAFYDRRGRFVIALQRFYRSDRELRADIDRYAR